MNKHKEFIKNFNKYTYFSSKLLNIKPTKIKSVPFYKKHKFFRNEPKKINKNQLQLIIHKNIDNTTITNHINTVYNTIQQQYNTIPAEYINLMHYYVKFYEYYIKTHQLYQQL